MIPLRSLLNETFDQWNGEHWIHYSDSNFLDVNENPTHGDPTGIYLFPQKLNLEKLLLKNYFGRMKYKMTVKISPNLKVFDVGNLNEKDCVKILEQLGHTDKIPMLTNLDWIFDTEHSLRFRYYTDRTLIPGHAKPSVQKLLWEILHEFIYKQRSSEFTNGLKKLGYDAIFDDIGAIMPQETQLIVFSKSKISIVKIEPNDLKPNVQEFLTEAKLEFKAKAGIDPEDIKIGLQLLYRYFAERGTLEWMYGHEWNLESVRKYWSEDTYSFEYMLAGGKKVEKDIVPGANIKKNIKVFRNPKNVVDYFDLEARKFHGDYVFRGMSLKEWLSAKKSGVLQSKGDYNLGDKQINYTFFGDKIGTAHSYAAGFAPYDRMPTRKMPSAIVAVPKNVTQNAAKLDVGNENEWVARQIPIDKIAGLWIITPIEGDRGWFELIYDKHTKRLKDGSRSSAGGRYAIIPKAGIALQDNQ